MHIGPMGIAFGSAAFTLAGTILRTLADLARGWQSRSWRSVSGRIDRLDLKDPSEDESEPEASKSDPAANAPEAKLDVGTAPFDESNADAIVEDEGETDETGDDEEEQEDAAEEEDDEEELERPIVHYSYEVNGTRWTGSRLYFGGERFMTRVVSRLQQDKLQAQYPVGAPVDVYFDPADPSASVLQPGIKKELFSWLVVQSALLYVTTNMAIDQFK